MIVQCICVVHARNEMQLLLEKIIVSNNIQQNALAGLYIFFFLCVDGISQLLFAINSQLVKTATHNNSKKKYISQSSNSCGVLTFFSFLM